MERDLESGAQDINFIHFNSHAHVERDQDEVIKCQQQLSFQLTRSRGAWPSLFHRQSCICYFNSHAHVERDLERPAPSAYRAISTHTLTWSVTFQYCRLKPIWKISTHTLTWSVTLLLTMETWQHTDFNSHAHVERDVPVLPLETYLKNFNSHAHVERDAENGRS